MLNIYYGSENIDKEKFLFKNIKGRTLLIVPDQFSLQAERDAFFYLKEKGLVELQIVDFSILGHKVVSQAAAAVPPLIDKYGRHMLLTKIVREHESELTVYKGLRGRNSFIGMLNSMISEMKRFEISPDRIKEAAEKLTDKGFLRYKLDDILKIYLSYEEAISGKYLDSEDYITFYGDKILNAPLVKGAEIWIYGFDTFTPKNMLVIERLLKSAKNVNVVMTYEDGQEGMLQDDGQDLFSLTGYVIKNLQKLADDLNEESEIIPIAGIIKPRAQSDFIKKNIWNSYNKLRRIDGEIPVKFVETTDIYSEAERAAAYILELVRNEDYRFGDIVVVCNDTELRTGILKRVFMRWGIPVFVDKKRKVLHHPAVGFILALMDILSKGYRDEAVMHLIKSGLLGIERELSETLENYVYEYKIRNSMWKKPFVRGGEAYTAEELNSFNKVRELIVSVVDSVRMYMGKYNTAGEKVKGLYNFLSDDFDIIARLEEMMSRQEEMELFEAAAETAQSWNVICNIFDQIVETIGDEKCSNEELKLLINAGLDEMEIGLVPVNTDSVLIGTLQRTRLSRIKAMLVVGANEGIIPMDRKEEDLLSEREKEILESIDLEISKSDSVMRQEERLALYRMFCLPQERLYISCSRTDEKGEEARRSSVFDEILKFAEKNTDKTDEKSVKILGNLDDSEQVMDMIVSERGALSYMSEAFNAYAHGEEIAEEWKQAAGWYLKNNVQAVSKIRSGMMFSNKLERIGEEFADALYKGDRDRLEVSASRLERYSSCPFSHFIEYGIRPEEIRVFELGAREIGDIYHECIMKLSQKLTGNGSYQTDIKSPDSAWMKITRDQCRDEIKRILTEEMNGYREGLLFAGKNEEYRIERVAEICFRAAWSLIEQIRKGRVKSMYFEKNFGWGSSLKPIKVSIGDRDIYIKGKIDRMDMLAIDDGEKGEDAEEYGREAVRIVDYKTGSDSVNIDYFKSGYKLQLMIYLEAAMQQGKDDIPAGIFYFKIRDIDTDADINAVKRGEEGFKDRMNNAYKLEGVVLNDEKMIEAMDEDFSEASSVVPVKRMKKDGKLAPSAGGYLLTEDEFRKLRDEVDIQVNRICREICEGNIDIRPKRERVKDMEGGFRNSCKFCRYKSICMFDTSFDGCRYEWV